jgi:hypothetical protein
MHKGQLPGENMGWLTPEEQLEVKKKKRIVALYKCDYCEEPISRFEMPVINPKGGYHKWSESSPKNCRSFLSREPKETYHQGYCNDERLGKKHKSKEQYMANKDKKSKKKESKKSKKSTKKSVKGDPKVMKAITSMVDKKPNHYDKRRVIKKLSSKFDKADIRAALNQLWADKTTRKKDGKYYLVEDKPAKKDKKKKKSKKDASDSSDSE